MKLLKNYLILSFTIITVAGFFFLSCQHPLNSSTSVAEEPPGPNCAYGGMAIHSGMDSNENGKLDESEIESTAYVCNGPTDDPLLNSIEDEPAGENCPNHR